MLWQTPSLDKTSLSPCSSEAARAGKSPAAVPKPSLQQPHLCAPSALMTVERSRPSLVVTCVMYCGRPSAESSTALARAALPGQSHREPGRWQQSPVVMAAPERSVPGPAPGRPAGTAPLSEPSTAVRTQNRCQNPEPCRARPSAILQPPGPQHTPVL